MGDGLTFWLYIGKNMYKIWNSKLWYNWILFVYAMSALEYKFSASLENFYFWQKKKNFFLNMCHLAMKENEGIIK